MIKRAALFITCYLLFIACIAQPKYEYWDADKKQVKSEDNYKRGIAHGKTVSYFKDGKIARWGWYKYGKQDSIWKFYYENGNPKAIEHYNFGVKQGHNLYYYNNGKQAQETVFKKDRPDSIWTS